MGGEGGREGGRGKPASQPASMLRLDDKRLKVDKFCLLGRGFIITPKSIAALHSCQSQGLNEDSREVFFLIFFLNFTFVRLVDWLIIHKRTFTYPDF